MTAREVQELLEVDDPFVSDGEKKLHCATWRFYDAGDDTIALCGAPLNGTMITDRAELAKWPRCQRCRELRRGLVARGMVRRKGRYSDWMLGR